jgi:superfamily II DNA/RNA helicase
LDMIQNRRALRTDHIKMFVLDEADEMLSVAHPPDQTFANSSVVSKTKFTIFSNSSPLQRKQSSSLPPCRLTSSKSPKNSCAIPFVS